MRVQLAAVQRMLVLLGTCEVILLEREDEDPLVRYVLREIDETSTALRAEAIGTASLLPVAARS